MTTHYPCDKFAHVCLDIQNDSIDPRDEALLAELIKAAKILDAVYLRQVSPLNAQFKQEIEDLGDPKLLQSYHIMAGPWDRLNNDAPFYGHSPKPLGAGFYPAHISAQELRQWLHNHPEDREAFESYTTIIVSEDDKLKAEPYSKAFAVELGKCAQHLRSAALLTQNPSLQRFLNSRAQALLDDDYRQSDIDWIHLKDDRLEIIFGPYEVYEDKLLGLKACFECYIGYKVPMQTRAIQRFASFIPQMQQALPIDENLKVKSDSGTQSPFTVIDLLYASGEAAYGIQTMALVLPNDPDIAKEHGTKKVLLRNVQQAKFDKILLPIAAHFVEASQLHLVNFDAFFRHALLHETGHSLGPRTVQNTDLPIYRALNTAYSPIEEAKADSLAVFLTHWLIQQDELPHSCLASAFATMIAGFFRAMRFGLGSAHAKANAIQLNYLLESGAITHNDSLVFRFDDEKLPAAVQALVSTLITLQSSGNEDKALDFIKKYTQIDPQILSKLQELQDIPVDIAPQYRVTHTSPHTKSEPLQNQC